MKNNNKETIKTVLQFIVSVITALYQQAQKLKRAYAFSNVNQVLYKYMDDKNVIKLPDATTGFSTTTPTTPSGGSSGSGQGGSKPGIEG